MRKKDNLTQINADRLARALIDRLIESERHIENLRQELDAIREQMVDVCAWLIPGVGLKFGSVLEDNSEETKKYRAIVKLDACEVTEAP
jgi:hypothetical protein